MKTVFLLIAAILFLTNSYLSAQNLRHDARPTVTINGNMLQNPWTGGANSPVFAEIDLNSDGKIDLITFDASGNRLSLYLNGGVVGQSDYVYAPQYFSKFPIMRGWVRTYDYDCDGDLDLMTYGNGGIMVYRNDYDTTGIHFSLATNQINTYYGSILTNLYVNQVVIPSFVDVDGDGDMDILDPSIGGTWIELHKNYAMDSTGNCSGFLFHVETHTPSFAPEMWGHFYMSSIGNYATLGIQRPLPIAQTSNLIRNIDDPSSSLSGGTALCAFDYGCDNDIDLLHGDQNGTNLLFLQNGAPPDSMISQDNLFPSYDIPVLMQGVACPGYIDLNNDGKKDLIVTPLQQPTEDYNNVWLYENQGDNCNPNFHRTNTRFMVDQMIDVGTSAHVAFLDVDADGLRDMLIANYNYINNSISSYSSMAYFRNTGSDTLPAFTLINSDFANCSAISQLGLHPTFGDINGDGDLDMLLGSTDGTLNYYQNTGGAGNPVNFVFVQGNYQNIDIGNYSAPQLIDVDRDGLLDLIIGERSGNLNYYHNTGSASSPVFTPVSYTFGGVNVTKLNASAGNSTPILFDHNGSYELLVGSESGFIYQYNNIDGNLAGTFTLLDSTYEDIYEPSHATIAMTDIDGDTKFDLLVGCEDGGVVLYTQRNQTFLSVHQIVSNEFVFSIYPSPVNDVLNVHFDAKDKSEKINILIADVLGNEVLRLNNIATSLKIDVHNFVAGIYFLRIQSGNGERMKKFIKE